MGELRYKAWGESRYTSGTTPTDRRYTGQIESPGLGLYFFNARWVDPWLGRFTQPDTLIPNPGVSQSWDRYAYGNNNAINYTDPTGHMPDDGCDTDGCTGDLDSITHTVPMGGFPAVIAPNTSNLGSAAEESYDPEDRYYSATNRVDPSAWIGMGNDILLQGWISRWNYSPSEIFPYLNYQENSDGSMNITSITMWNNSATHVSLESMVITAEPDSCGANCITNPYYHYAVSPPGIGTINAGIGVVSPYSRQEISLTPSGSTNPNNSFSQNYTIGVAARFGQYFAGYDTNALFRLRSIEIER